MILSQEVFPRTAASKVENIKIKNKKSIHIYFYGQWSKVIEQCLGKRVIWNLVTKHNRNNVVIKLVKYMDTWKAEDSEMY